MASRPTILIVDDLESYRSALERALGPEWTVHCASEVDEACRKAEEHRPDIALVDVRLSEIDPDDRGGMSVLEWLRTHRPEIPVVMMTAYRDRDAVDDAKRLGASAFLRKPINLKQLRTQLSELVRARS